MDFKPIKEYAFIISMDKNYILPVQALLNSIIELRMTEYADIIIFYEGFDSSILFAKNFNPICIKNKIVPYSRYLELNKFAYKYKSVCILDGDMIFLSDVKKFFKIAENNFMVGCNDDTCFNRKNIIDDKDNIIIKSIDFYGIICNVPFFFNYEHTKPIWKTFYKLYKKCKKTCDYDLFNYSLALNPKITESLISYPSCCFTGVHYTHLKYQTMFLFDLFEKDMVENKGNDKVIESSFVLTRDFMRVYSFHGKFFHPSWIKDHEKYMTPYYENEHGTNKERLDFFIKCNEKIMKKLHKIFAKKVFDGEIKLKHIYDYLPKETKEHLKFLRKL
jgi:hypothetical protein